ncbi:MAG: DUF4410 domain-containing protein [Proteobacteria bacterium]|nr:DUF4410 domain-containing protein [Pseudomonadota bacterium]
MSRYHRIPGEYVDECLFIKIHPTSLLYHEPLHCQTVTTQLHDLHRSPFILLPVFSEYGQDKPGSTECSPSYTPHRIHLSSPEDATDIDQKRSRTVSGTDQEPLVALDNKSFSMDTLSKFIRSGCSMKPDQNHYTKKVTMKFSSLFKSMAVLFVLFLLVSCVGTQNQPDQAAVPFVKKLAKQYDTLLFSPFTANAEIATGYPQAAKELQHSMMTTLQMEKQFKKIDIVSDNQPADGKTLIIKANITDLRIVNGAARFWGGAMAGSSGVELNLQLIDSATKKVIRDEKMSSWNNAFGAAWSGSDNTLLDDMGKIVAQNVIDSMPAH